MSNLQGARGSESRGQRQITPAHLENFPAELITSPAASQILAAEVRKRGSLFAAQVRDLVQFVFITQNAQTERAGQLHTSQPQP